MTESVSVEATSRTHVGLVRQRNEDAFYQGQWLYVVADGLGGHVAGDIASTTAIEAVRPYDKQVPVDQLANVLGKAIYDADAAIRREIGKDSKLAGMGTTMVAMLRSGRSAVLANIGDSRAYLVRNHAAPGSVMTQISEDHTYRYLVAHAHEVPTLPEKLARFLDGRKDGRSPDLTALELHSGDRVLLCSDGLSSYVPEDVIETILNAPNNASESAEDLVQSALSYGGQDNVTVCVIDIAG